MMRRSSVCAGVGGGGVGEPLIVVEESGAGEESDSSSERGARGARGLSVELESPPDPYLLSPWRDTRKHSLPTPACTSGPTASQVRRLSERGEGQAREAREAAFLATLSQAPPQPGGRRHSVVTISRVPQSLFGRARRESVAAFPAPLRGRRDSVTGICPPTDNLGSSHNLQLDIMDDIVAARKVRMRLWNTSKERLCEVTPLDERAAASAGRYSQRGRRHSDLPAPPLPPIPARRRASEQPPAPPNPPAVRAGGIVCTDTDLHHLLDALTSSATEIDRCGDPRAGPAPPPAPAPARRRLADARSSSFDASSLQSRLGDPAASWFARRHQTLAVKKKVVDKHKSVSVKEAPDAAVLWDKPSGSLVDASALGSAIEVFLRKGGAGEAAPPPPAVPPRAARPGGKPLVPPRPSPAKQSAPAAATAAPAAPASSSAGGRWFPDKAPPTEGDGSTEACDASLRATRKDLFVK